MATMRISCLVMDEATGVTYMDTLTTSVGRVALSGPEQGTPDFYCYSSYRKINWQTYSPSTDIS